MMILGCDLGTSNMGWALVDPDEPIGNMTASGHLVADKNFEGFGKTVEYAYRFNCMIDQFAPDLIVFEGYAHHGHQLAGSVTTGALFRYIAYDNVPYMEVSPRSLKSFVCGPAKKGEPHNKDKIMLEVYKRWAFEGSNDECDAYALAMFGAVALNLAEHPKTHMAAVETWRKNHGDLLKTLITDLK